MLEGLVAITSPIAGALIGVVGVFVGGAFTESLQWLRSSHHDRLEELLTEMRDLRRDEKDQLERRLNSIENQISQLGRQGSLLAGRLSRIPGVAPLDRE